MTFDPQRLAVLYYFGDLQYWRLPLIAADALNSGHDGPALRRLAGMANSDVLGHTIVASDMPQAEIDSAFREMGVPAPISKEEARLALAWDSARRAISGESNLFNEATHIRVHLCEFHDPPQALSRIVSLSKRAETAPETQWAQIEREIRAAMTDLLRLEKPPR